MRINDLAWVPSITSVILTVIIFIIGLLVYVRNIKKFKPGDVVTGYCLLIEMFVNWCRQTTREISGGKAQWAAPYFAFLIIYISINNLVSVLGIANPITQLTVPLALGSVTFMIIFVVAIKYKNKHFFKEYLNPNQFLVQFSPWISLSFRLFGNIISGVIVTGLIYSITSYLWEFIPIIGQINILGGFLTPPFHFYFDIFQGILQSYVFAVLTIAYWGRTIEDKEKVGEKKKTITGNLNEDLNVELKVVK